MNKSRTLSRSETLANMGDARSLGRDPSKVNEFILSELYRFCWRSRLSMKSSIKLKEQRRGRHPRPSGRFAVSCHKACAITKADSAYQKLNLDRAMRFIIRHSVFPSPHILVRNL